MYGRSMIAHRRASRTLALWVDYDELLAAAA
jgi:hypothetical protein